jgi:Protein of unknown function (DUF2946)
MIQRMRRRLQKFLPIVLLALAVQILAPIAACWAAAVAASDPLQTAVICHEGTAGAAQGDQGGQHQAHDGSCAICCLAQASGSFTAPETAFAVFAGPVGRIVWSDATADLSAPRYGSNTQARAPPFSILI